MLTKTTLAKALEINENPQVYGTFAEIGAGQEVARFFFIAGRASQTIAKTMSAYDMIYSDEIYGKETSGRYVCEPRLVKMLDKEFSLLQRRLSPSRGDKTTFFAFADTVATGDGIKKQSHGWLGVRFQTHPGGPHNDIILHVRLVDKYRIMQQEALGIVGVNLVSAAFTQLNNVENFIPYLVENIKHGQVIIDMIRFTGPDVQHFSNDLMNLELVRRGLSEAVLYSPDKTILTVSDSVYGKPLIVARGNFRPITNSHLELMNHGREYFKTAFPKAKEPIPIFEISMHEVQSHGKFNEKDFLDRVNSITSTGHHVLVSQFLHFYKLKHFLRLFTKEPIAMLMGASSLDKIFNPDFYAELEGGIMEGLGKLLDPLTRLFIFPHQDKNSCMTAASYLPHKGINHVYCHFFEHSWLVDMANCEDITYFITSDQIAEMIKAKDQSWKKHVPASVVKMIEKEGLFGLIKPS